jgi:hypothetical protein
MSKICGETVDGHPYECWRVGCPTCDYPVHGQSLSNNGLRAVFSLVEPKSHWKDPISASVPLDEVEKATGSQQLSPEAAAAMIREAVIFYTATPPRIIGNTLLYVQAAGYRAGPAGDR